MPRVDLYVKSSSTYSGRVSKSIVLNPDQTESPEKVVGLRMTVSSRLRRNIDINRVNEMFGNFTVAAGTLLVSERNFDRQTHNHHNLSIVDRYFIFAHK